MFKFEKSILINRPQQEVSNVLYLSASKCRLTSSRFASRAVSSLLASASIWFLCNCCHLRSGQFD